MNASSSWSLWKDLAYQTESVFDRWVGGGDMKYADFHFETVTWNTVVLWLSESIIPTQNFVVTPPTEIKDWQTYILRVQSWDTPVNMGLAWWIINPHWTSTTLTPNAIDMFVFLAVWNVLELQPEIVMWWGWSAEWWNIRWNIADQTDLQTALSLKADDNAVVHNTWNETVAGTKTFSTSPVVPSKTTDATNTGTAIATEAQVYKKQDTLTQGTWISISSNTVSNTWVLSVNSNTWAINIKTINSTSLIWTGNITTPTTTVVNNLTSTSTTSALSANQWRILNWKITDLMALWKFLSLWNATTGQPVSFPYTTPYTYNTWDYFLVSTVSSATPPVNYRPTGSSYTWTASSTAETDELEQGDVYIYDWSVWLLQSNHWKTVSFANIAGQPTDNINLATALGQKQDNLTAWTWISIWTIYDYSAMRWPCPAGFHVPSVEDRENLWRRDGEYFALAHFEDFKLPPQVAHIRLNWQFVLQDYWIQSYLWATYDGFGRSYGFWTYYADHDNDIEHSDAWSDMPEINVGYPIRPFKDVPVIPDDSWINNNWAYHNPTLWLISWIGADNEWHTMADKNLWATEVWELTWPSFYNRPTPTQANIWNLYQRWNNYWFPFGQNPTKTSTEKVDVSWYWPWEYTSDTFIITQSPWESRMVAANPDLRWGVTWPVELPEQIINNTWVLSVNWSTWAVTVETPDTKVFNILWWLTEAQAAYDRVQSGKKAILDDSMDLFVLFFSWEPMSRRATWMSVNAKWDTLTRKWIDFNISWDTVTSITQRTEDTTVAWWIQNDTTWTTTTVSAIRAWTEAEYNSLGTYDQSTIYHIY